MARSHLDTAHERPAGRFQALYWREGEGSFVPDTFPDNADARA